jgi:hypothetical protein
MYASGHTGSSGDLRDTLRRLEAALLRHEDDLREARRLDDGPAIELLRRTAMLLAEEIERVRRVVGA